MSDLNQPLVLRKKDHVVVAVYNEKAKTLTELQSTPESAKQLSGDYSECELCFNPSKPTAFAHATTTHLRYSEVIMDDAARVSLVHRFEVELPHVVVHLTFSPCGTYLVTYAVPDPKRTAGGNLSVFATATGELLRRSVQARWPALEWSADETYVVRLVHGCLHVLDGSFSAAPAGDAAAADSPSSGVLSKLDLMLAHDKEIAYAAAPSGGPPILAVFKAHHKQRQASFALHRLPDLRDKPMFEVNFGRSEDAAISWSRSGRHVALLVKAERDPSGKSYYGSVTLHLIDVGGRNMVDIRLKGEGESIHDCQWSPRTDELLVVHGRMPRNKTTLYNKHGVALATYGEGPRNMGSWAPNGLAFVLGGSGNLAGDYQFYSLPSAESSAAAKPKAAATPPSPAALAVCTGEFNEKCSFPSWAPDSHNFMCVTAFTRLRVDNKIVIVKNNGERVLSVKYDVLYGAHWVVMRPPAAYATRPASPRPAVAEKPKAAAYRPPGGTSRAAALLRRPDSTTTQQAKPAGPVGATVVTQKKKKRR